jgi:hypothetical protein
VGLLSQKHATIIRLQGMGPATLSFIRQGNLGSHKVKHQFLYLPDCPMALMGRDLFCKLRAQIAFDPDIIAALKLRGPEAKILALTVTQEEEWQLYAPEGRSPEIP